jgi:peptidylprolyl isomerase
VGGLDQAVTVQTLAEAFVPFGEVVDITLPKPDVPNSGDLHRGFGYVEFDLPGDAAEAIDNMDGSELYGRTIKVAAAKPQKESNEGLGSKTAIWEQVGPFDPIVHGRVANYACTGRIFGQIRGQ